MKDAARLAPPLRLPSPARTCAIICERGEKSFGSACVVSVEYVIAQTTHVWGVSLISDSILGNITLDINVSGDTMTSDRRMQGQLFAPLDRYGRSLKIGIEEAEQFRKYFLARGKDPRLCDEIQWAMTRFVKRDWNFVMVNAEDLEESTLLLLKMDRSKHCQAIYTICIANLEFASPRVGLDQQEIAAKIGITTSNASACMVQMQKAGLITSQGRHGTGKRWFVSPASCWIGDEITRRVELANFREMIVREEQDRKTRRKTGPRSKADLKLDADVIDIQAGFDAKHRQNAVKKCDDLLAQ